MRFGSWIGNAPSRFIGEIPESLLEIAGGDEALRGGHVARERETLFETPESFERTRMSKTPGTAEVPRRAGIAEAPKAAGEGSYLSRRFKPGAVVIHPNYGEGTIRKVEGSGKDMKVTVHFPRHGEKKFLVAYAPFRFA
jgi:DNA helicase-2/ATP-dependent DNA helicase PcrA